MSYQYNTPGTSGFVLDTNAIQELTDSAVEKVKNIQLPSKQKDQEKASVEKEKRRRAKTGRGNCQRSVGIAGWLYHFCKKKEYNKYC